jgi:hypothetical protein
MSALARAADVMSTACRHPLKRSVGLMAGVTLAAALAAAAALSRGAGPNGIRFAANLVLFSSSLVFVLYYVAGPLSRLLSVARLLGEERFALAYGFAGMMAVFVFLALEPDYATGAHTSLASLTYGGLTAGVALAFVMSAGSKRAERSVAMRTVQSLSCGYFWLVFAFTDADRMIGPHRPDGIIYGLSLLLLAIALPIRFADAFMARRKAAMSGPAF